MREGLKGWKSSYASEFYLPLRSTKVELIETCRFNSYQ